MKVEKFMLNATYYFRGPHLIRGYSTSLDYRPLLFLAVWIRGYAWFDLYLGHDLSTQQSLFLGIRKIPKMESVACLEGRLKSINLLSTVGLCMSSILSNRFITLSYDT